MSRGSLQHLPCAAIVDTLQSFASTDLQFLLVESHLQGDNRRIEAGEYFPIDLSLPPFDLKEGVVNTYKEQTKVLHSGQMEKVLVLIDGKFLGGLDFHKMKTGCVALPAGEMPCPAKNLGSISTRWESSCILLRILDAHFQAFG